MGKLSCQDLIVCRFVFLGISSVVKLLGGDMEIKNLCWLMLCITALAGCASGGMSWSNLKQFGDNGEQYCRDTYQNAGKREECIQNFIVLQRAQEQCQKDSDPGYCLLMAEYGWNNFKDANQGNVTRSAAENWPIICGWKNKPLKPCSDIE